MKTLLVISKIVVFTAAIGVMGANLSACNTIAGVGEDVSAAGKGITKGAEKTKKKL